jgi:hypothetical protein
MDVDNTFIVSKTRCPALKGQVIPCPGQEAAAVLLDWLSGQPAPSRRDRLIGRIHDLAQEAAQLGQPVSVDPTLLAGGTESDLLAFGKELRARVDALKGSNGR